MSGPPTPRIYPDTFYVNGTPIPAAYFQTLDTEQFQSVNGDAGGTWTSSGFVNVSGAGLWFCGPTTFVAQPGVNVFSSGSAVTFGDGDDFVLPTGHVGQNRTLVSTFGTEAVDCSYSPNDETLPKFAFSQANDAVVNVSGPLNFSGMNQYAGGARCTLPLRVHDGATIGTIIVSFIVSVPHTSLPAVPPAMRVVQVDPFGNTTFLTQSGSGLTAIGNGMYAFVLPSTAGAWYAMGGTQEISFVTSGAPVVSVAGYTYFVQIIDEAGAGAMIGNQYLCALAQMTGITSTRFQ